MNKQEILEFIKAFKDFMNHAETEEFLHETRSLAQQVISSEIEKKAADLEITCDYYMMEFM
jgi:hypothetical protein